MTALTERWKNINPTAPISLAKLHLEQVRQCLPLILRNHRVFVVFDEIHHCSGSEVENANIWGQQVLTKIQGLATFTLALSGTPWRSDSLPIVMGEYSDPDGQLLVDYQYTLKQAIADGV